MPAANRLKHFYFSYLSKPAADRVLYRAIRRLKPRRILELGVGLGVRTRRLIATSLRYQSAEDLRYIGIDQFEARPATVAPGLTLKQAHCAIKYASVRVQLLPGDPYSTLARSANSLTNVDLMLIAADQDPAALERSWFFVPRMLHDRSLVMRELPGEEGVTYWERVTLAQIKSWAAAQESLRRAA